MKYLLALMSGLLSMFHLYAQEIVIKGKITDEHQVPVSFVTISLTRANEAPTSALSDDKGAFSFHVPAAGSYGLHISHIKYEAQEIPLNISKDTSLIIILNPATQALKEIKVTAAKPVVEQKIDKMIFNVASTLTAERGDALDVLSVTPAVNVMNETIGISGRGSVSIAVNGKMLNFAGSDLISYLKAIPSNSIERIEIMTNPSAKYSAEGNTGILNIVLKRAYHDFWSSTIRSSYTQATYATAIANGNFDYRKKQITISASAGATNGSNAAIERQLVQYPDQIWSGSSTRRDYTKSYNGRLLADYNITPRLNTGIQLFYNRGTPSSKDHATTNIAAVGNEKEDSIQLGNGYENRASNNISLNMNATYKLDTLEGALFIDIDYYNSFRKANRNYTSSSYNADHQLMKGTDWYSDITGINRFSNYALNIETDHMIRSFDVNYGARFLSSHSTNQLDAYGTLADTNIIFDKNNRFKFSETTYAGFFTTHKKLSEKVEMQAGIRVEHTETQGIYTRTYTNLFPTYYISYKLNANHVFSFNYGRRIERPGYQSLNPFKNHINQIFYTVGNPYLLPSYVNNFELHYTLKGNLSIAYYNSFASNVVAQASIPDATTKIVADTSLNAFNSFNTGVNVFYALKIGNWLESTNQLNLFYQDIHQRISYLPQSESGVSLSYSLNNNIRINNRLSVSAGLWYAAPQYMGIYRQSSRYNLTAGLYYKVLKNKVTMSLQANDIAKRQQAKLSSEVANVVQHYNNYYDSRYIGFTIQYKFGNQQINGKSRSFRNEDEKQRSR